MTAQTKERPHEAAQEKPKMFFAKIVADKLAKQLRAGNAPTQKSAVQSIPYNPCTGRSYHGINALNLMMEGSRDPRWMTFDDAKNAGYKVKSGEKGVPIQNWFKKKPGQEKAQMQTTWLFNADQLQFIPPLRKKPERPDPYERVAEILENSGATVIHDQKLEASYNATRDEIHLPSPDKYDNINRYCQDALNAYFHSTGHPSRLDRETFDAPRQYMESTEELICAVSTTMMCAELGIPSDATRVPEMATTWADNIEEYPVQFSQAMKAADDAVWRTMRQEQMRNIELNPHNNETWRPIAEASPAIAVTTLLTQREVLALADKEPAKVNAFNHDGVEVFTKPGTGYILSKTGIDTPGQDGETFAMQVKIEGYDREGNTYDVVMEATVRKNDSGLVETVKPPEAKSINLSTREMALPLDWSGEITISPCHEDWEGTLQRGKSEDHHEFYGAFAEGENSDILLATFDKEKDAKYYASLVERQMDYQQDRQQTTLQEERGEQQPEPEQDREKALQDAKEKVAERLTEEAQDAEKAVARIAAMIEKKYTKPNEPTPYMKNKEVGLVPGVYQNGNTTCVPLYNTAGELRSMAYISEKGRTTIAKGTEGEANKCAHFDKKAVERAPVVAFAVGLANSATIAQAHNDRKMAMVTAIKDADLPTLTAAFKQAYPDKQQVIFATNDHAYEKESGRNPGQYYAKQAAEQSGALIVSPRFAADETTKDFTNFNDLATKSDYGREAVKEQTEGTIEKAKEMAAEKTKAQTQEKTRGNKELAR